MKKNISFIITILIIFLFPIISLAYSNNNYSIEIPIDFHQFIENQFYDDEGNCITIQTTELKSANEFQYTEKFLNTLIDSMFNSLDDYKIQIKEKLIKQYEDGLAGQNITRAEIEEIVNPIVESMKYEDCLVKELSTFTKNSYPCFHYISNISSNGENAYTELFQFVSGKTLYTISISSKDKEFFNKEEIKNAINSFTLNNYEEYAFANSKSNEVNIIHDSIKDGLIYGCLFIVIGGIYKVINKQKSKKIHEDKID